MLILKAVFKSKKNYSCLLTTTLNKITLYHEIFFFKNPKISIIFFFNKFYTISRSTLHKLFIKFGINANMPLSLMTVSIYNYFIFFISAYFVSKKTLIAKESRYFLVYHSSSNYKSYRQLHGLPVRGQRTCSNAKTCRSVFFHNKLKQILKAYKLNI